MKYLRSNRIILPCTSGNCFLCVEKHIMTNGFVHYNISILDSDYDHALNTLGGRLLRMKRALFGKPLSFTDLYIKDEEAMKKLVSDMQELIYWHGDEENYLD